MSSTGRVELDDCKAQSLTANLLGIDGIVHTRAGPGSKMVPERGAGSMARMIRSSVLANLFLLLSVLSGGYAQELPSGGTFRLTSRLVYVDVVVRDRSGQVVHGLTQRDFKIEEDGKLQKAGFLRGSQPWTRQVSLLERRHPRPLNLATSIYECRQARRRGRRYQHHPVRPFEHAQIRSALRSQATSGVLEEAASGTKCGSLCADG